MNNILCSVSEVRVNNDFMVPINASDYNHTLITKATMDKLNTSYMYNILHTGHAEHIRGISKAQIFAGVGE